MSDKVIVICPTITGREETFERMRQSYHDTIIGDMLLVSPKDEPTWGIGISKGMEIAKTMGISPKLIHFTSDDIEAHDGWYEAAVESLAKRVYPAPMVMNPNGTLFSYGHGEPSMHQVGPDWKPTVTSVVPSILPEMWDGMAPMVPWHFFTDDYLTLRARQLGFEVRCRHSYRFTHHASNIHAGAGMGRHDRMSHDMALWQHYLNTGEITE